LVRLRKRPRPLRVFWAAIPAQTGTGMNGYTPNPLRVLAPMPSTTWRMVWPLRFRWPRLPRGLNPVSPRLGRCAAFAVTCRGPFRIGRFAPPFAEASPTRLAFAAGQVRLAFHPGVNQGEWSDFKPAGSHLCVPAVSASSGIAYAFPQRGRSALRGAEAPRPYRRTRRSGGFRLRSERAAPHLPRGLPLFRREPHPAVCPCGLRRSRRLSAFLQSGYPSCYGLSANAAFRPRRPGPSQAIFPAFIDSRNGLSQQPNASVRVASR